MNEFPKFWMLLVWTMTAAGAEPAIQRMRLDPEMPISVPVATNRVTTIGFPSRIDAIDASGVTTDPKMPALFLLSHSQGSSFLSVRALEFQAVANLNIRWKNQTYVLELHESPRPILALNLETQPVPARPEPAPRVSATRLLALLDKAKVFPLLKQQHPEAVAQVEVRTFGTQPQVTDFSDYQIQIHEIFRFNPEDTLVFHLSLTNRSNSTIHYAPDTFSVQVGDHLYLQSISDAPGVLFPQTSCTVYFAITGTADGGRNELSVKNEFTILVRRLSATSAGLETAPLPLAPQEETP